MTGFRFPLPAAPNDDGVTTTIARAGNPLLDWLNITDSDGVTLVLLGSNSKIDMNSGGTLKLEAPTEGDHPGFAVIGDPSATTVQTNTVQGGAGGYIRGVWYTPKHKLYITGNGDFNTASNYFPVVADNVEIGGNGEFHLGFDWEEYDYPEPLELQFTQPGKAKLVN